MALPTIASWDNRQGDGGFAYAGRRPPTGAATLTAQVMTAAAQNGKRQVEIFRDIYLSE